MIAANKFTSYSNAVEYVWYLSLNCNVGMQIAASISGEYLYVTAQRWTGKQLLISGVKEENLYIC